MGKDKKLDMKKTPEQLVNEIQSACAQLGWHIGMNAASAGIRGLVIGQGSYVEEIISQLADQDEYEIYAHGESVLNDVH